MNAKAQTIVTAGVIALAAAITGCGGGGSSVSPAHAIGSSASTGSGSSGTTGSTPAKHGNGYAAAHAVPTAWPVAASSQLPAGTVGVTVSIRIPPRTVAARARAATAKQKPAYIQSTTDTVEAQVTLADETMLPVVAGSCTTSTCTIVIPVPLAVASSAVLELVNGGVGGTEIGQATASFNAGQFTEGVANTIATPFTFQPLIENVVVGAADANSNFSQGYSVPSFGTTLYLLDTIGDDVGSDMDGALDMSGNPLTPISLTANNIAYGGPSTVTIASGSPASDISLGTSNYNTNAQPDLVPSGGNDVNYIPLSASGNYANLTGAYPYNYAAHSFNVSVESNTPAFSYQGTYGNYISYQYEYPAPSAVPSPTAAILDLSENIPADATSGVVYLDVAGGQPQGSSSCLSFGPFYGYAPVTYNGNSVNAVSVTISGQFYLYSNSVIPNLSCSLEIVDGPNGTIANPSMIYDYQIYVNNPTIYVDGKARKK
jgi:hypothetical protein